MTGELVVLRTKQEMIVVGHQAVGCDEHLDFRSLGLTQEVVAHTMKEKQIVVPIEKDGLVVVTPVVDVIVFARNQGNGALGHGVSPFGGSRYRNWTLANNAVKCT
jgi:hypothetical protein